MSRRSRLALLLFAPALVVALAVGLVRETNEGTGSPPPATVPGFDGEAASGVAVLQPVEETIDVPAGSDCTAASDAASPACRAFQVLDTELAWLVEQESVDAAPRASFLQRESPTRWRRVLAAEGGTAPFERVNVRVEDIDGDGRVEAVFAFHLQHTVQLDVVDAAGEVVLHLDLGAGQARVEDGALTVWLPAGDDWRRQELTLADGEVKVLSDAVVEGPAAGNI